MKFLLILLTVTLFLGCEISHYSYGTIKKTEISEIYGIQGASGGKYVPINLPAQFQEENMKIEFSYELVENNSESTWGKSIYLKYIAEEN